MLFVCWFCRCGHDDFRSTTLSDATLDAARSICNTLIMRILTILTLHVPQNRRDEVVAYYDSARILEASGAETARLCTKPGGSGTVVVIAQWPDISAYEAWQASEARLEFSRGIQDAAGGTVTATGEVLEIVGA